MRGRTALITGSTSGIGAGIAESLAAAGMNIVLNGFGDSEAVETQRRTLAAEHGVEVQYDGADLSDVAQIEAMMASAATRGGIDVLVNNAGIQHVSAVESFAVERWDAVLAINLSSVFHTIRLALPGMRERRWGRIINIASAHGLVASPQKAAYVAAKHAVLGLTKVVALETARSAVTCNAICPGWVLTPLVQEQIQARAEASGQTFESEKLALLGEKQPSMEFVTPAQIGASCVFLCSAAADQIRGASLSLDGGWTAQ